MKKADIIKIIADRGINKTDVSNVLESFMKIIKDAVESGEDVTLRGFGTFKLKKRAKKIARNIKENKSVIIPPHYIPYFKPADEFEEMIIASQMNQDLAKE